MADRAGYISGLRKLADLLEDHPEVPLPYQGQDPTCSRLSFNFLDVRDDNKAAMAAAARAFPGKLEKGTTADTYFDLRGNLDGLYYELTAYRHAVCERVVTGTQTITRAVPDPSVKVPLVEVTEDVEVVEWRCSPIMAP